ncbi:mismatched base pair and cruciform DNA recognition protein [Marasmius fiardii PR-910]|nr:mismatched base pair and cruciform DNA recognition protein [Marasmius fiardii PR-910]
MSNQDNSTIEPNKTTGAYHNIKGNAKETIGNVVDSHGIQRRGQEEQAHGERQYDTARDKGFNEGVADSALGKKEAVVGAATGDGFQQAKGM